MRLFYVAIEKSVAVFELYKALWEEHKISGIMAETMSEGIEKAVEIERSEADALFFISIVADEIDFLPQLPLLREVTSAPILIATSNAHYTETEHHEALRNGADFYARFCEETEQNLEGVLSVINCIEQRARNRKKPTGIITHGKRQIAPRLYRGGAI